MRRPQAKKSERRKGRSSGRSAKRASEFKSSAGLQSEAIEHCHHCTKNLKSGDQALFVEEEVGRTFCSEQCITHFFSPEIERLEKEFYRRLDPDDFTGKERQVLSHLRWTTLQEPDEIWKEKTLTGDFRYTLLSEFPNPQAKSSNKNKIWCVCICLFLRGEPSFLYLAFPTRSLAMANLYRRGERINWQSNAAARKKSKSLQTIEYVQMAGGTQEGALSHSGGESQEPSEEEVQQPMLDCLADEWTEDETIRAQLTRERSENDIPKEEYGLYQACLTETLEAPDEVWSFQASGEDSPRIYHFIRHYPDEKPGVWYLIVARDTDEEDQIEILDAFPSRDPKLIEHYRCGEQEIGQSTDNRPSLIRIIH